MKTSTRPILLSAVSPGMTLALDSAYCLNLSMANMAARHVPVTCHLYDFPRDMTVNQVVTEMEPMDSAKPGRVGIPARFRHVSIE